MEQCKDNPPVFHLHSLTSSSCLIVSTHAEITNKHVNLPYIGIEGPHALILQGNKCYHELLQFQINVHERTEVMTNQFWEGLWTYNCDALFQWLQCIASAAGESCLYTFSQEESALQSLPDAFWVLFKAPHQWAKMLTL